jgi:Bacterial Ig-like domain (group 3)
MKIKSTSRILAAVALLLAFHAAWSEPVRFTQVVLQATPVETLTVNPTTVNVGTSVRFDVNVTGVTKAIPTGSITYTLTPSDGSTPLTTVVALNAGTASWFAAPPVGNYTVVAVYSGDTNYRSQSASGAGTVLFPDFDFTVTIITVKQGETWTGMVKLIPINGFNGSVVFSCVASSSLGCSFPSTSVSLGQPAAGDTNLGMQLSVTAYGGQFIAASLLMFGFTFRSPRRRLRQWTGLITAGFCLFAITGCGTSGQAGWKPITPKGSYQATITGVSGNLHHSKQVTINVQ